MRDLFGDEILKDKTVIIIEDDAAVRDILHRMFERVFKTVYEAKDGQEGLDLVLEKKPNLIVTDLDMPVMGGRTMIKILKEEHEIDTPILVISGSVDTMCIEHLVHNVLTKPIDSMMLATNIEFLLK